MARQRAELLMTTLDAFLTQAQARQAFTEGQLDGYAHGRYGEDYEPAIGNVWIGHDHELASAYADGYVAGWNAGLDAREECTL
jgi:hypothetical protein